MTLFIKFNLKILIMITKKKKTFYVKSILKTLTIFLNFLINMFIIVDYLHNVSCCCCLYLLINIINNRIIITMNLFYMINNDLFYSQIFNIPK